MVLNVFDNLEGDLFGLPVTAKNEIALFAAIADHPVAVFHELMEYLYAKNMVDIVLINSGKELQISAKEQKNTEVFYIYLDKEAQAIAKKASQKGGEEQFHYLLRAFQRQTFGEEDRELTREIKRLQRENQRAGGAKAGETTKTVTIPAGVVSKFDYDQTGQLEITLENGTTLTVAAVKDVELEFLEREKISFIIMDGKGNFKAMRESEVVSSTILTDRFGVHTGVAIKRNGNTVSVLSLFSEVKVSHKIKVQEAGVSGDPKAAASPERKTVRLNNEALSIPINRLSGVVDIFFSGNILVTVRNPKGQKGFSLVWGLNEVIRSDTGGAISIGWNGDVKIDGPQVSRSHAVVERKGNDLIITDESTNGTTISYSLTEQIPNPAGSYTLSTRDLLVNLRQAIENGRLDEAQEVSSRLESRAGTMDQYQSVRFKSLKQLLQFKVARKALGNWEGEFESAIQGKELIPAQRILDQAEAFVQVYNNAEIIEIADTIKDMKAELASKREKLNLAGKRKKLNEAANPSSPPGKKDYYAILGVERSATLPEIEKARIDLLRKWHPDRFMNGPKNKRHEAEERTKEINAAFDVLKDPLSRALYDRWGNDWNKHKNGFGFIGKEYDIKRIEEDGSRLNVFAEGEDAPIVLDVEREEVMDKGALKAGLLAGVEDENQRNIISAILDQMPEGMALKIFKQLNKDLFGFPMLLAKSIALFKGIADNLIARFHELAELLHAQGKLTLQLEGDILKININGQEFQMILDEEAISIARQGYDEETGEFDFHYLLRALQRQIWPASDAELEQKIQALQEKNQEVIVSEGPVGAAPDNALLTKQSDNPGGIDLNPDNLNLRIKRDNNGVPLPVEFQDLPSININVEGFYPVIESIRPATFRNLPFLISFREDASSQQLSAVR